MYDMQLLYTGLEKVFGGRHVITSLIGVRQKKYKQHRYVQEHVIFPLNPYVPFKERHPFALFLSSTSSHLTGERMSYQFSVQLFRYIFHEGNGHADDGPCI